MKKIDKVINNKGYLLGVYDEDWIYLQKPSWDCGWYWGFGYLHYHSKNDRSWHCHTHFDSVFFDNGNCTPKEFNNLTSWDRLNKLDLCTLSKDERWKLLDYMKTFYTLKESAEVFGRGGSHFTSKANMEIIKKEELVTIINKIMLPELFNNIEKLFIMEDNNDQCYFNLFRLLCFT